MLLAQGYGQEFENTSARLIRGIKLLLLIVDVGDLDEGERGDSEERGNDDGKSPRDGLVLVLVAIDVQLAEAVGLLVDRGVVEDSRLEVLIFVISLGCR